MFRDLLDTEVFSADARMLVTEAAGEVQKSSGSVTSSGALY